MSHFSEIYYPTCKNCVGFLNSVWQVNTSFEKGNWPQGSNKTNSPPVEDGC